MECVVTNRIDGREIKRRVEEKWGGESGAVEAERQRQWTRWYLARVPVVEMLGRAPVAGVPRYSVDSGIPTYNRKANG